MFRILLLSSALLAGFTARAEAADLKVSINGANPVSGRFLVSVFDRSDAWMKSPIASKTLKVATDGSSQSAFTLPSGTYAIALIHDANGNGEMDTNALGIPTEAYGFSNGARARFGPPPFERAAFKLAEPGGHLTISLDRAKR